MNIGTYFTPGRLLPKGWKGFPVEITAFLCRVKMSPAQTGATPW